jgi:non-reducing end alpha-L-arabinofuranosidase
VRTSGSGRRRRWVSAAAASAVRTFSEGAIVAGYPSDTTDNAVQANIVAAGYR